MRGGIGGFAGFRLETIRHRRLQPRVRQLLGEHRLGYGVLVKTSLLFPKRARQRVFEERPSKDARGDLRAPALAPRLRLAAYLVPAAQSRRALEVHAQLVQHGHGRGEVPVHDVLRVDVVQTARVETRDGRLQRQRDVPDFANPRVRRKGDARERGGVAARVPERVHQTAQTHAVAHVQREIVRSKVVLANGFLFVEQFVPVVPEPAEHVALAVAARLQRGADHVAARLQSRAFSKQQRRRRARARLRAVQQEHQEQRAFEHRPRQRLGVPLGEGRDAAPLAPVRQLDLLVAHERGDEPRALAPLAPRAEI